MNINSKTINLVGLLIVITFFGYKILSKKTAPAPNVTPTQTQTEQKLTTVESTALEPAANKPQSTANANTPVTLASPTFANKLPHVFPSGMPSGAPSPRPKLELAKTPQGLKTQYESFNQNRKPGDRETYLKVNDLLKGLPMAVKDSPSLKDAALDIVKQEFSTSPSALAIESALIQGMAGDKAAALSSLDQLKKGPQTLSVTQLNQVTEMYITLGDKKGAAENIKKQIDGLNTNSKLSAADKANALQYLNLKMNQLK